MMKSIILLIVLSVLCLSMFSVDAVRPAAGKGKGGKFSVPESFMSPGVQCVTCTAILALVEQYAYVHPNKTTDEALDFFCEILPAEVQPTCISLVAEFGATIVSMLENEETPDAVCQEINFCTNLSCNLFPPPSKQYIHGSYYKPAAKREAAGTEGIPNPFEWILKELEIVFNNHVPLVDIDKDNFSTDATFRGYSWRGMDCNDLDASIYPGRKNTSLPDDIDHNCNGIFGTAPNGRSWEEELCNVPQYGVIILGDSAGAHFHIPPAYVTAKDLDHFTYKDLLPILTNEFDWPEMSATTGYMNMSWIGAPLGPINSTYLYQRERNLCMHRDYQNIAVNGARAGTMAHGIVQSLSRSQDSDQPALVSYALIGNDVCNSHHTLPMTTPQQFYAAVLESLNYLDDHLPAGSHVVFTGLVDGRILYDTMYNRIHPIGQTRNDVTYAQFYDYMNCLDISPCFGWMNTNATIRNETTARAFELDAVYDDIIANHTFKNFDMIYLNETFNDAIEYWISTGNELVDLIEPVDGFHPTQTSNALIAYFTMKTIEEKYPWIMPEINPNNALILELFGDQGGYTPSG